MSDVEIAKIPTLKEQYLLKDEKVDLDKKAAEAEVVKPVIAASEEVAADKAEDTPAAASESTKVPPPAADKSSEAPPAAEEGSNVTPQESSESNPPADEETSGAAEQEESGDQVAEETPEIKLETAPADFRFPTTNQTRHCFTRYIEYHRCIAVKGEGSPECTNFAKYYRSLCPSEWIERWNEQRENGTFPGPL
ncbi:Cytochrome c oxidase, subunit VIb [Dillenia turbinata]|uniref:Cytochrome c oxidase, subunit VIb n=1 Tax=Dillenia turbinata TaxID=194707 RepID=A0AAN8VTX9_9MAGN